MFTDVKRKKTRNQSILAISLVLAGQCVNNRLPQEHVHLGLKLDTDIVPMFGNEHAHQML
ncbi:hypothetical protein RA876_10555 [Rhodoferax antarcticus]|nr:hypothetical protein RA876_10555 [Rhodoferax antarcticus]